MMLSKFLGILLLVGSLVIGWQYAKPAAEVPPAAIEHDGPPTRRSLQRAAWNSDTWLLVYQSEDEASTQQYAQLLAPLAEMELRGVQLDVRALADTPDSLLSSYPTILVGTDFPVTVREHLSALPAVDFASQAFAIGDIRLDQTTDFAQFTYLPSLWNEQLPLHLIWGQTDEVLQAQLQEKLAAGLRSFLWSSWGYEIIRDGQTHCLGYFNDSTWVMDKKIHFEFNPEPELLQETAAANYWAFDGAVPVDFNWQDQLTEAKAAIESFLEQENLPALDLHFYPSVERKAMSTGRMEQVHYDEKNPMQVPLVSNDYFRGEEWGEQYRPWLRSSLGKGPSSMLEQGLALQWADQIRGLPWRAWVYRLALAGALPPLDMLYDEKRSQSQTPLIGRLAAGAWTDYCLNTLGKDPFLTAYQKRQSPVPLNKTTQNTWRNWIIQHYASALSAKKPLPQQRLDGFTLAHEGYRIYNGYGSARARQSLEALDELGVDAISVVPYSYMNNPRRATPIPVARRAGTENDEAVLFSHFSAQALGQFTLMKPQVWLGSGSWPGEVAFDSDEEWDAFFVYYKRWIIHYALLSEMYGVDALCIGTELRYTTLQQPDAWRALISDIRKLYTGALTYAANWGDECEGLSFWRDLDFIGVNAYYPLHSRKKATDEQLLAGAKRMLAKIETIHQNAQRPVWLTELGYRSAESPWISPHAEADRREVAEADQARCYEALLSASQEADWLKGLFWWKWPSDISHDESDGRGYMPLRKPSAQVLSKYYR